MRKVAKVEVLHLGGPASYVNVAENVKVCEIAVRRPWCPERAVTAVDNALAERGASPELYARFKAMSDHTARQKSALLLYK